MPGITTRDAGRRTTLGSGACTQAQRQTKLQEENETRFKTLEVRITILKSTSFKYSFSRDPDGNQLPKHIINSITVFRKKQKKGTIDVWWLYDDGGKR